MEKGQKNVVYPNYIDRPSLREKNHIDRPKTTR